MENRTVKFYMDLSRGDTILPTVDYFTQDESIIFNDRREIEKSNKDRFICSHCLQNLSIRGGIGSDKRILHFVHPSNDIICSQKSLQEFFTKSYILAKKFKQCNESELHKELKFFIAEQIGINSQDFSNIEIEKREYHDSKRKGYHIPDVKAKYKETRVAFELQLSTTFLHEIVKRETYYRDKREMYLIWIFSILKEDISDNDLLKSDLFKKFTTKDIFYSNYWNLFVIDQKAMLLSKERKDLVLRCFYKVGENFLSEYVSFSDLTFEEEKKIIYYKKPVKIVKKVEHTTNKLEIKFISRKEKVEAKHNNQLLELNRSNEIKEVIKILQTISVENLSKSNFVNEFKNSLQNYQDEILYKVGDKITGEYLCKKNILPITHFINEYLAMEDFTIHKNASETMFFLIDKGIFTLKTLNEETETPLQAILSFYQSDYLKLRDLIFKLIAFEYHLHDNWQYRRYSDLSAIDEAMINLKNKVFDNLYDLYFSFRCVYKYHLSSENATLLIDQIRTLKAIESIKEGKVIGYNFPNIIQVLHNAMEANNSCKSLIKEAYETNKDRLGLKDSSKIYSYKIDTEQDKKTPVYKLFKNIYPSVFNPNN